MSVPKKKSGLAAKILRVWPSLRLVLAKNRQRKIILYSNNPVFTRKLHAFAGLLLRQGFRVQVMAEANQGYSDKSRALLRSSPDLWILFSGRVIPFEALPPHFIFYIADPIDRLREHNWVDEEYFRIMGKARQVWSYNPSGQETVARLDLPFHVVPFGYAPYYERDFKRNIRGKKLRQDIDILFFGQRSERRVRMLEVLKKRGMRVLVLDRENALYGEKLDECLARSKIVLSLYYHDDPKTQTTDFARIDQLLANRIFVLHEKPFMEGLEPGFEENVTTCDYGEIPDTCSHLLARPEERSARSEKARRWFRSNYNLHDKIPYPALKKLLAELG